MENFQMAFFTSSNSRLLFSHGQRSQQLLSSCFPPVNLSFDLLPWPSKLA